MHARDFAVSMMLFLLVASLRAQEVDDETLQLIEGLGPPDLSVSSWSGGFSDGEEAEIVGELIRFPRTDCWAVRLAGGLPIPVVGIPEKFLTDGLYVAVRFASQQNVKCASRDRAALGVVALRPLNGEYVPAAGDIVEYRNRVLSELRRLQIGAEAIAEPDYIRLTAFDVTPDRLLTDLNGIYTLAVTRRVRGLATDVLIWPVIPSSQ